MSIASGPIGSLKLLALLWVGVLSLGPHVVAHAQPARQLTIASFGGALDANLQALAKPFEESRKITIRWVPGGSAENVAKAAATAGSSEYDIVMTDTVSHRQGSKRGLFATLDPAIMTNYKDIYPQARMAKNDGVGLGSYYGGLFYNRGEFAKRGWAAPTSWNDLFRPELCGRVGMPQANNTVTLATPMMLVGGDPKKMDEGLAKFAKLKGCIPVLESSASKLEEKIQLGEYLIGVHGQHRVIPLIRNGVDVGFILPNEGSILFVSVWAAMKESKNLTLAQEFINHMISAESQKVIAEKTLFGPVNQNVKLTQEQIALGIPGSEQMKKLLVIDEDFMDANRREWARKIERAIAP